MEMMVVMGIIALMMAGSIVALRSILRTDLRSAAARTAGALRYTFDRATMTGNYMRLAFDIDKGEIWPEFTEEHFGLRYGDEQYTDDMSDEEKEELKEELERRKAAGEEIPGETSKKKKKRSMPIFDLLGTTDEDEDLDEEDYEDLQPGIDAEQLKRDFEEDSKPMVRKRTSFKPLKNIVARKVKLARGIKIIGVTTPRMKAPIRGGRAYVYFFPQGHSEPAIIHLGDADEDFYSVVLHPLTGRAKVYPCLYRIPDEFGLSDDERKAPKGKTCMDLSELE
jgi:hypothetical protein